MSHPSNGHASDGRCPSLLQPGQQALGKLLREETAQTLGFVLVQLAALEQLNDLQTLRQGLSELHETVRPELTRILDLAHAAERASE